MQHGRRVDKNLVDAIAGWVRGAVAEMRPQDVTVIDANLGRVFTVADEDQILPGEAMAQMAQLEQYHRSKIMEVLSYIPGVIVAVNVRADPVLRQQTRTVAYQDKPAIERDQGGCPSRARRGSRNCVISALPADAGAHGVACQPKVAVSMTNR